jgi:hypothetical protein
MKKGADAVQERSRCSARKEQMQCKKGADAVQERSRCSARKEQMKCKKGADAVQERSRCSARKEQMQCTYDRACFFFHGLAVLKWYATSNALRKLPCYTMSCT